MRNTNAVLQPKTVHAAFRPSNAASAVNVSSGGTDSSRSFSNELHYFFITVPATDLIGISRGLNGFNGWAR